jgi:hypothetical protein
MRPFEIRLYGAGYLKGTSFIKGTGPFYLLYCCNRFIKIFILAAVEIYPILSHI